MSTATPLSPRPRRFHPAPGVHRFFAAALLALIPAALSAQEKLSPATLAQWTASGPAPRAGVAPDAVALPSGGQLARAITGDAIEVHLVSRPYFGATTASWPALEVGPVTLTFVRDEKGGGVVLLGDQPLSLPQNIPLEADGRSRQPLEITLAYSRPLASATLTLGRESFSVPATTTQPALEIALSSGSEAEWNLDLFEFRTFAPPEAAPGQSTPGSATGAGDSKSAGKSDPAPVKDRDTLRKEAGQTAAALFVSGDDDNAEKTLSGQNLNPKNSAEWHLETANDLVQTAYAFTRAGRPDKAVQIARRALQHLDQAVRKTDSPPLAAAADKTAAMIQETLLADLVQAKALYRSAAQRYSPGGGGKEAERIEKTEAEAARKGRAPNR